MRKPVPPRSAFSVLLLAVFTASLGGCAPEYGDYAMPYTYGASTHRAVSAKAKIPVPDRALLEAQAVPDCDSARSEKDRRTETASLAKPALPSDAGEDASANLAQSIKLEYERECYRQAELRAREKLKALQAATAQTIGAVKRVEQGGR